LIFVLCASFVVAEATARLLRTLDGDRVTFVVTGEESRAAAELAEGVRQGVHPDDVALCLELDRFPFAMVATLEGSLMVLRPRTVPELTDDPARSLVRSASACENASSVGCAGCADTA
jgi:2-phosphosulfolactate phosphatase